MPATASTKKSAKVKARAFVSNVDHNDPDRISYGLYCSAINSLDPKYQVAFGLPPPLLILVAHLKELVHDLVDGLKIGIKDIIAALKQKDIFALLKGIGFNLKVLAKDMIKLAHSTPKLLIDTFKHLEQAGWLDKIQKGAATVDELLHAHPVLTKVGGVVIGALLFYMWINASFVGHPTTDLDVTTIVKALRGEFDVTDIFASPEGIASLILGLTGIAGVSVGINWLGNLLDEDIANTALTGIDYGIDFLNKTANLNMTHAFNLGLALIFTGLMHAGKSNIAAKIKPYLFGHKDIDKQFKHSAPLTSSALIIAARLSIA